MGQLRRRRACASHSLAVRVSLACPDLWRQLTDCASAFSVLPFRDPALVLHRMISLQMFLFCADYPSTQLDLNGFIAPLDGAGDETHAAEAKLMRKARRSGKLAFIDPMTGKPARLKQSASALQIDELARQRRLLLDSGQAGHLTELSDLSAQIDLDALRTLSSQYSTAVHAALSSSATSSSATTGLEANIAAPASSVSAVPAAAAVPISASASSLRLLQHLQDSLASHAQARATLASKAALSSSSSGGSGGGGGGADPLLHLAAAAVDGASSSTTAAPSLLQFAESLRRPPASSTLHTFPPPPLLSAASSSDRSLQSLEAGSAALHEEEQEEHKAGQVPESHPFLTHEHSQASAAATPLPSMHPSLLSASSSSSNAGASIEFSLASIYAAAANAAVAHPAQQQPR